MLPSARSPRGATASTHASASTKSSRRTGVSRIGDGRRQRAAKTDIADVSSASCPPASTDTAEAPISARGCSRARTVDADVLEDADVGRGDEDGGEVDRFVVLERELVEDVTDDLADRVGRERVLGQRRRRTASGADPQAGGSKVRGTTVNGPCPSRQCASTVP